jgi:hypothetical protein
MKTKRIRMADGRPRFIVIHRKICLAVRRQHD